MKQHITIDQLNELTQPQRKKLRDYMLHEWKAEFKLNGEEYTTEIPTEDYLLSIGQMIEFLSQHILKEMHDHLEFSLYYKSGYIWKYEFEKFQQIPGTNSGTAIFNQKSIASYKGENKELCDALWEAVKDILEK